jgi:hypothetical protein
MPPASLYKNPIPVWPQPLNHAANAKCKTPITEGDERNRSRGLSGATSPVTMPANQQHPGRGASGSCCDPCGIGSMCGLGSRGYRSLPRSTPCCHDSNASGISLQPPPITEGDERNSSRGLSEATSPVSTKINQQHPGRGASGSCCDPCGIGSMCGLSSGGVARCLAQPPAATLRCLRHLSTKPNPGMATASESCGQRKMQKPPSPKVMKETAAGD